MWYKSMSIRVFVELTRQPRYHNEVKMSLPSIDRNTINQGNFGVMTALLSIPDTYILILTELVKERGEQMWIKFREWRDSQKTEKGFGDWVQYLFEKNVNQIVFPRGCDLDDFTRSLLCSDIIRATNARTDMEVLEAHFEIEPRYGQLRQIACKGCPNRRCRHYLKPTSRNQQGRRRPF